MATKLFFVGQGTSDYATGNNDANLRGTATADWTPRILSTAAGTTLITLTTSTVAGATAGVEVTISGPHPVVFYSAPLDADVTISGSITWNLWAAESSNSANVAINGRLEKIDGATGVITLIDQTARTTEVALTTNAVNNFAETPAAGVACKRGDRLRVRVFGDDSTTMGSGFTFTFGYSGPTAAANGDSWLQLTETLTFVSEPAGSQVFPTATAGPTTDTPVLTTFTGADESPLSEGGTWSLLNSSATALRRISNAVGAAATDGASYYNVADYGPEVFVSATIGALPSASFIGLVARAVQVGGANTWDGYVLTINTAAVGIGIQRYDNGVFAATVLANVVVTHGVGDRIGLLCVGSTLSAYRMASGTSNWVLVGSGTDATYSAAGKVGIRCGNTSALLDDFNAATSMAPINSFYGTIREAWTSRGAGASSAVVNTATGFTPPIQVTDTAGGSIVDWFTRPLTAFTLGGAVRCNVRMLETPFGSRVSPRVEVAVVNGDGTGATAWATGGIGVEMSTAEAVSSFLIAGDDVAVTAGQRLRIRFFIDDASNVGAMVTAGTGTLVYAGTSAAASGDTYLTFTQTLTEAISAYQPRHGFVSHQNPGTL